MEDGGVVEVAHDRDPIRGAVEDVACVPAGEVAVDDRHDVIALRGADQPIGSLPVREAEVGFAVDDRGGPMRA